MKLNKDKVREAKNLNKHQMDNLMEEANKLKAVVEELQRKNGIDLMLERLDEIRAMMDVATGKMTTKGINWKAVYKDPYERYNVNAKALYENDRETFDSYGGTVTTVRSFDRFERI